MRYGFIYETTNLYNGMKYIGQHKRSQNLEDPDDSWYLGSGTRLTMSIKHAEEVLGESWRSNYSRIILCECDSKDELNEKEEYYLNKVDAANNEDYYNITNKSSEGYPVTKGMRLPDYWRENCRKAQIARYHSTEDHPLKREESKKKSAESIKRAYAEGRIKKLYGKDNPASRDEVKEKISKSTKEAMWRPEVREKFLQAIKNNKTPESLEHMRQAKLGENNPCYNKIWINNGKYNRRVSREEFIEIYKSQGFIEGALCNPYGPLRES